MEEMTDEKPQDSAVFEMTNGEKIRISYDNVFSYVSKGANATVVEIGWGDRQTYILDIDFDSFDAKLTQYKADIKAYYCQYW